MTTAVDIHTSEVALSPVAPASRPVRNVRLSELERRAIGTLISSGSEGMERYAQDRASGYSSGDPGVRLRSLGRAAAVHEAQAQELAVVLAAAIARRDLEAARVIDRVLSSAVERYQSLLAQLRVEAAPTRKVSVSAKGVIAISAEEQG